MKNKEVASVLYEIADLLEIQGVEFKPRAYRKAAQNIEGLGTDIEELASQNKLEQIPGVGKAIAGKIKEYLESGRLRKLEELREQIPVDIRALTSVEGIGPKMVKTLYETLGIKTLDDLERAAREGRIRQLKGFGEKVEQNILENIAVARGRQHRFLLGYILPEARRVLEILKPHVEKIELAGSIRRRKETIGDIDILAVSSHPEKVMDIFTNMKNVEKVLAKGITKSSVRLDSGIQIDVRIVEKKSFGSALQYFTGSKEHNVAMRKIAIKQGCKLNEYGLFRGDAAVAGVHEEEIYRTLGMQWIPPELRENRGEIEAAMAGNLPHLVAYEEVKGDLQMHTQWSDGAHTIEEMVEAARHLGHRFIAITDHSGNLPVAGALDEKRLLEQAKEINSLREKYDDIHIFHGTEVNILKDGSIDMDARVLEELDVVLASIHSAFRMDEKSMTSRLIRAIENEVVDIIAHPTCRIIQKREPIKVDMTKVLEAARDNGVVLEINAYPERLDLNDVHVRMAVEIGVKLSIGTDAHQRKHLQFYEYGVAVARRGWAEKNDVINTYPVEKLERLFGK